jgi:hypothetical protein
MKAAQRANCPIAPNYFKYKMISNEALPAFPHDVPKQRGELKCQVGWQALAQRAMLTILHGAISRPFSNGQICCSTGLNFSIPSISTRLSS